MVKTVEAVYGVGVMRGFACCRVAARTHGARGAA